MALLSPQFILIVRSVPVQVFEQVISWVALHGSGMRMPVMGGGRELRMGLGRPWAFDLRRAMISFYAPI